MAGPSHLYPRRVQNLKNRACVFLCFFFLVVLPWHPFFLFLAPLVFKNPPGAQVASRDPSVPKGFTAPASSSTSLAFLSLALTFAFALRIFALPFGLSLQGVVIGWVCITFTFFLLGLACPCSPFVFALHANTWFPPLVRLDWVRAWFKVALRCRSTRSAVSPIRNTNVKTLVLRVARGSFLPCSAPP